MIFKMLKRKRAVTLTELLVVIAILTLLATIAVPVYISKIQQTRVAVAQAEVRNIAEAMQAVAITHGFYVPIRVLNNVPNNPNAAGQNFRDDFNKPGISNLRVIDAFTPITTQTAGGQLTLGSNDQRVRRMVDSWQGPFLNPRRVFRENNVQDPGQIQGSVVANDYVLDPWGRPYRFYTSRGVVGSQSPPRTSSEANALLSANTLPPGIDDGIITDTEANRFDRFAIVSFGPNGITDDAADGSTVLFDDIFYSFAGAAETTYNPF